MCFYFSYICCNLSFSIWHSRPVEINISFKNIFFALAIFHLQFTQAHTHARADTRAHARIKRHNNTKSVSNVLVEQIQDTIKRNSFPLPKHPQRKKQPKQGKKIEFFQINVALFRKLFIAHQYREAALNEFFCHETQAFPPSLSEFGELYNPDTRSQLLDCMIKSVTTADGP